MSQTEYSFGTTVQNFGLTAKRLLLSQNIVNEYIWKTFVFKSENLYSAVIS